MKTVVRASLALLFVLAAAAGLTAQEASIQTVQDIQKILPLWGTAWTAGNGSENGYYRTFYVGYAMRQETPERIHIRQGRGNNTRVSVILDQQTITDYLFDLKTRHDFYASVTKSGDVNINPKGGKFLPQLEYFQQIIESPAYNILPTVQQANAGQLSEQELYNKSLETLKALNPGRVFDIRLDLAAEFNKWKADMQGKSGAAVAGDAKEAVLAIDSLVWGRINYASKPSAEVLDVLAAAVDAAQGSDEAFQTAALKLFKAVTGTKYKLQIVDNSGNWADAIQCPTATTCTLNYPEFTAIYPNGSVKSKVTDQFGNRIANFATPGLWSFVKRGDGVDHIRNEPYYGWIPKMDYQALGNGFHNPAVRNYSFSKSGHAALRIPMEHQTLWAVLRGPVSHGCSRLPVGGILEMRFIMPVSSDKMVKINHFGHKPQDFDVYDIDGNGTLEVMGVKYAVAYEFQDREASSLEIGADAEGMAAFHKNLYGSKNVYDIAADGTLIFHNPQVSLPSYLDDHKTQVTVRPVINGDYPLYEQDYEQDKVQYYSKVSNSVAQLMGKVRGCAPSRDADDCGQSAFRAAAKSALGFTNWK